MAQDRTWIELWTRQDDGRWLVTDFDNLAVEIDLPDIGATLAMADVYTEVPLDGSAEVPGT